MLSVSASLSRRGRSAQSAVEPGLPDKFIDRKPAKAKAKPAKAKAPPGAIAKRKNEILKCKNLKVECHINDAWHKATIKDGPIPQFLPGYEYTVVYDSDKYQEKRVYDEYMRLPA